MALTHPPISVEEFAALMDRVDWRAAMEPIDGEIVVIPSTGGEAALAQTEAAVRIRAYRGRP